MNELMGEERLRAIYRELGDDQVLNLMRNRDNLTETAERVLMAEMSVRGLTMPEKNEEEPEDPAPAEAEHEEAGICRLCRFQLAADAETAMMALEEAGIPCRVDQARSRETEEGAMVAVPGLDLFVDAGNEAAAKVLLRKRMQLFPEAEVDSGEVPEETEPLYVAGSFETEAKANVLENALKEAGIVATTSQAEDNGVTFWDVEVTFSELEPALDVAERIGMAQWPVEGKTWTESA